DGASPSVLAIAMDTPITIRGGDHGATTDRAVGDRRRGVMEAMPRRTSTVAGATPRTPTRRPLGRIPIPATSAPQAERLSRILGPAPLGWRAVERTRITTQAIPPEVVAQSATTPRPA